MFNASTFIPEAVELMKAQIKSDAVIAASGGIDSTVAAALAHKAIGSKLHPVFVDTGLVREGETAQVSKFLGELGLKVEIVDAADRFFRKLEGVSDPEKKRKIIGEEFIRVFEEHAKKKNASFLIQGTIAPDWIESGSGLRANIKSHHNVGGLPEKHGFKIVEPLRDLYKDEVYKLAKELGVKQDVFWKQPFPGPGLGIRVLGEITREKVEIVRKANFILMDEIANAVTKGTLNQPWQYFCVLLPQKSVGVQGDARAYGCTIAIRSVEAVDGMTATFSHLPFALLQRFSERITNELKDEVTRVVYDVTNKPPACIEWE